MLTWVTPSHPKAWAPHLGVTTGPSYRSCAAPLLPHVAGCTAPRPQIAGASCQLRWQLMKAAAAGGGRLLLAEAKVLHTPVPYLNGLLTVAEEQLLHTNELLQPRRAAAALTAAATFSLLTGALTCNHMNGSFALARHLICRGKRHMAIAHALP